MVGCSGGADQLSIASPWRANQLQVSPEPQLWQRCWAPDRHRAGVRRTVEILTLISAGRLCLAPLVRTCTPVAHPA